MNKALLLIVGLLFSAAAAAQQYKWVDKDGKVRYGDVPPPGVKATPLRPPPSGAAPAPSAAAKKPDAKKSPDDEKKEKEKLAEAEKEAKVKRENCGHAQEALRNLESGQRIARTDSKGERYYLEDAQIAQETAKARQTVQQWCN
jgi:hypothetical protein